MFAGTQVMNNLRENFFTNTAFTGYQYRYIGGGNLSGYVNCSVKQILMADDSKTLFY